MPDPTMQFLTQTEAYVQTWHGIAAPNDTARRLASDLAETIRGFEAQRARLRFEDEPSSFAAALSDPALQDPPAAKAGGGA